MSMRSLFVNLDFFFKNEIYCMKIYHAFVLLHFNSPKLIIGPLKLMVHASTAEFIRNVTMKYLCPFSLS